MLRNLSRTQVIEIWFAALFVAAIGGAALGLRMSGGTAILVAALCLTPPAIVMVLWPRAQTLTAADVLRGADSRGDGPRG
jgi:hypothetical protein